MAEDFRVDRTLDIKGQVCPLTFVRSKLAIENMAVGEILEIVVDHQPAAANVPRSMAQEGQKVLKIEQAGENEWRLFIRKDREKSKT
jgi:tRNA 2-thiouridine synthesizing protein A